MGRLGAPWAVGSRDLTVQDGSGQIRSERLGFVDENGDIFPDLGVGGLYIGQVGWLIYANTLGTPLARPVTAFVTAEVAYGLRFRRNFDLRAQRVEPVDRTSLR